LCSNRKGEDDNGWPKKGFRFIGKKKSPLDTEDPSGQHNFQETLATMSIGNSEIELKLCF